MNNYDFFNVDSNILQLFEPSQIAKNISNEPERIIKAEDASWSFHNTKSLVDITLECIATNFELFVNYFNSDKISEKHRNKLMNLIPTNLPLSFSSKFIPDGVYWKRCCFHSWSPGAFIMQYKNSWKRTYMEKFLQDYIENTYPNDLNLPELKNLLKMLGDYVYFLDIQQLLIFDTEDDHESEIKHVDLQLVLSSLSNLEVFKFTCGTKQCDVEFARNMFEVTLQDCVSIGQGLAKTHNLHTFRIHRCVLNQTKLFPIVKGLKNLQFLKIIEFMSCHLMDDDIPLLNDFLSNIPLEELYLVNNNIGPNGANSLARGINKFASLKTLNLRLNFILDEGGIAILTSASVHKSLEKLILAGCEMTTESVESLCHLILNNRNLLEIDLSVNRLNLLHNDSLVKAVLQNEILQYLDLRMNVIDFSQEKIIIEKLSKNRRIKNKWKF